jgi:hypothetical protein
MDIHLYKYIKYKKKFLEHKKQYGGIIPCYLKSSYLESLNINNDTRIDEIENKIKCFKNKKNDVMNFVKKNGKALEFASDELQNNSDIVNEAISKGNLELQNASDKLKNNCTVVTAAVKKNGIKLQYASNNLKDNLQVVIEAVKNIGLALQYASNNLKGNIEVVTEAVKNDGRSLQYASDELKNDPKIVYLAISNDYRAFEYASNNIKDMMYMVIHTYLCGTNNVLGTLKSITIGKNIETDPNKKIIIDYIFRHCSERLKEKRNDIMNALEFTGEINELYTNDLKYYKIKEYNFPEFLISR